MQHTSQLEPCKREHFLAACSFADLQPALEQVPLTSQLLVLQQGVQLLFIQGLVQGLGHLRLQLDGVAQALKDGGLGGGSIQAARGHLLPEQAPAQRTRDQGLGFRASSSKASRDLLHPGAHT